MLQRISHFWNRIQGYLFPLLEYELGPLTAKQQQLVEILEVIQIEEFIPNLKGFIGRPKSDRAAIARAFVAKSVYNLTTTRALIDRLQTDISLRRICGWEQVHQVPDESTFSRAFAEFSSSQLPQKVHHALIKNAYQGELIGHVSIDSTPIEARETPQKKEKEKEQPTKQEEQPTKQEEQSTKQEEQPTKQEEQLVLPGFSVTGSLEQDGSCVADHDEAIASTLIEERSVIAGPLQPTETLSEDPSKAEQLTKQKEKQPAKRGRPKKGEKRPPKEKKQPVKRGRPKKGEERPPQKPKRLDQQLEMTQEARLNDLPKPCDVGAKLNSKGHMKFWIGYKLHIASGDGGVPLSCILTSASVHDSQVAIPSLAETSSKVANLYDLMDSAYDCPQVLEYSRGLGHIPLVDKNVRRDVEAKREQEQESLAQKTINWKPPEAIRYNQRSTAERVNSRLKDEFGGRMVRVRGNIKVACHLMFGILALTADALLNIIR